MERPDILGVVHKDNKVIGPAVCVAPFAELVIDIGEFTSGCVNLEICTEWAWSPLMMLKMSYKRASLMTCSTGAGPATFVGQVPDQFHRFDDRFRVALPEVRCVGVNLNRPVKILMTVRGIVLADFHLASEYVVEEEYFQFD